MPSLGHAVRGVVVLDPFRRLAGDSDSGGAGDSGSASYVRVVCVAVTEMVGLSESGRYVRYGEIWHN